MRLQKIEPADALYLLTTKRMSDAIQIKLLKILLMSHELWLRMNRHPAIIKPLWNIVVAYYAENPYVVDRIINLARGMSRLTFGETSFELIGYFDDEIPTIHVYNTVSHKAIWIRYDIDMFSELLIMPDSHGIVIPNLADFREYLYNVPVIKSILG